MLPRRWAATTSISSIRRPARCTQRKTAYCCRTAVRLSVFALVFVRLAIRFVTPSPQMSPQIATWQHHLAGLMHAALYVFLIVMPLLGWLTLSASDKVIPFFGLELPSLIGPDKAFASALKEIHETIGTIGYYLIGLHAAAALYHHYFVRDDTLLRMLPQRGRV